MPPLNKKTPKTVMFNRVYEHHKPRGKSVEDVREYFFSLGLKNDYLTYKEILITAVLIVTAICSIGYAISESVGEMNNGSPSGSSEIYTPDPLSE